MQPAHHGLRAAAGPFSNGRGAAPLREVIKIVARQIGKHGGMRGLRWAAKIEAELHSLGEKPWR